MSCLHRRALAVHLLPFSKDEEGKRRLVGLDGAGEQVPEPKLKRLKTIDPASPGPYSPFIFVPTVATYIYGLGRHSILITNLRGIIIVRFAVCATRDKSLTGSHR